MRIAALIKQIPRFEELRLGPDGRLSREGLDLEINPFCRRAISKGVELAKAHGGTCTVITLGPPQATDALREAVAWGADDAILITDPAFAGSDTLATSKALFDVLERYGPFDLVLAGMNSVDADTGQVAPGIAQFLGYPFLPGAKELEIENGTVAVRCEEDDGESSRRVALPCVVSVAERLCQPCKVDRADWINVSSDAIRVVGVKDLGQGPHGARASATTVGEIRVHESRRERAMPEGSIDQQLDALFVALDERGVLRIEAADQQGAVSTGPRGSTPTVAVVIEPGRAPLARELLGAANALAASLTGEAVAIVSAETLSEEELSELSAVGADRIVHLRGSAALPENVATSLISWARAHRPWAILAPSTTWGRETASRAAVALSAGLTGDAVALEIETSSDGQPRLVAWKPALQGHLVAAIRATSDIQMATVRPGVLALLTARQPRRIDVEVHDLHATSRVEILESIRNDDVEALARATRVVCLGAGVAPEDYPLARDLARALGAELAATRKVADKGWLPRARQVGITGRSISPQLYVTLGVAGSYNHMIGIQAADTVVAVNANPDAPIFESCDVGIVGDWQEVATGMLKRLQ